MAGLLVLFAGLFSSKAIAQKEEIRNTLFGDMPIEAWVADANGHPWSLFKDAQQSLLAGKNEEAKKTLLAITGLSDIETRHTLQAWCFLRKLGVKPPAGDASKVLGVIVEVGLDEGTDLVVAYADGTARYFNYSGVSVVWDRPDKSLDSQVFKLLQVGQVVAERAEPWGGARPYAPKSGDARVSMLTPSGLRFEQAPMDVLSSDTASGPVVTAAFKLMRALVKKRVS